MTDSEAATDLRTAPLTAYDDLGVACVEMPRGASHDARSVVLQMSRLDRELPDGMDVVVSISSLDRLTVELLAGISVGHRLMTAHGRRLLVRVPGRPPTPGATAILATLPFVVATAAS